MAATRSLAIPIGRAIVGPEEGSWRSLRIAHSKSVGCGIVEERVAAIIPLRQGSGRRRCHEGQCRPLIFERAVKLWKASRVFLPMFFRIACRAVAPMRPDHSL